MKIKQIVGEHKKGVRAMKYAKKPQNTIAPKKPETKVVKPGDQIAEDLTTTQGKITANDGKTITVAMPDGTQIQKPIASAIGKDPQTGAPVFNVMSTQTPGATNQPQVDPAQATAMGSEIPVNTGTPVEDTQMGESHMSELASLYDEWMNSEYAPLDDDAGDDREVIRKAASFLDGQVNPDHIEDMATVLASHFHGGDVEETGGDVGGDPTDEFIKDVEEPVGVRETADNILLDKMLTIAGLR